MHIKQLDGIRGFAAIYVVMYHFIISSQISVNKFIHLLFSFGQEAVMLFFVLSGFVIYLSVYQITKLQFQYYWIRRFRRIYFPFTIAIILSIIIAWWNGNLEKNFAWDNLVGNFLMLQDYAETKPGTWFNPFLGNLPLWSLSYEWWFYMLFYPIYTSFLFKHPQRLYIICFLSTSAYLIYMLIPNQIALFLSYFIIWWCGVEAADIYINQRHFSWRNMTPIYCCLLLMSALSLTKVLTYPEIKFGYYPFLMFRHFFSVFLFLIIGLIWYQRKLIYFRQTMGLFTGIAALSYGLYIFHFPILNRWQLSSYIPNFWLEYVIKFTIIIGLSYLVEIKLQPLVNKLLK